MSDNGLTGQPTLRKPSDHEQQKAAPAIRALAEANAEVAKALLLDRLTGLANRRFLEDHLSEAVRYAHATGCAIWVFHVGLDRFHLVNETLGHDCGDAVLIGAARVLAESIQNAELIARVGSDEFIVVAIARDDDTAADALASAMRTALRRPIHHEGHVCRTGASVGVARGGGPDIDVKTLLIEASIALRHAKASGRNAISFFTPADQAAITARRLLSDDIRRGLERGEFVPYYQPQFDARSLNVVGFEALVRWNTPDRGVLTPDKFLGVAEDLGVVAEIDDMIMRRAVEDLGRFADAGRFRPKVAVNVSSRRLAEPLLAEQVAQIAPDPQRLCLELLENTFLDGVEASTRDSLAELRRLGVAIAIDDFGTGHASIASLIELEPDYLKIDRQFVIPILESSKGRRLVASMIDIGAALGQAIVAEGVESMEHAEMLGRMGCDMLQGYGLARPASPDQILDHLRSGEWNT